MGTNIFSGSCLLKSKHLSDGWECQPASTNQFNFNPLTIRFIYREKNINWNYGEHCGVTLVKSLKEVIQPARVSVVEVRGVLVPAPFGLERIEQNSFLLENHQFLYAKYGNTPILLLFAQF